MRFTLTSGFQRLATRFSSACCATFRVASAAAATRPTSDVALDAIFAASCTCSYMRVSPTGDTGLCMSAALHPIGTSIERVAHRAQYSARLPASKFLRNQTYQEERPGAWGATADGTMSATSCSACCDPLKSPTLDRECDC